MDMPERSFGRTVRYRRTKLGLSQTKLGELVGRSTATIRSWERDNSKPNDPKVLSALAAILGVDERTLFGKAGVAPPVEETAPTVEQALASLGPSQGKHTESDEEPSIEDRLFSGEQPEEESQAPVDPEPSTVVPEPEPEPERQRAVKQPVGVGATAAYVAPPEPYVQTPPTPNLGDMSYMEDSSQRQMYRVRTLATLVALFALVVAFIWAVGEGLNALGDWWDAFFGGLRL